MMLAELAQALMVRFTLAVQKSIIMVKKNYNKKHIYIYTYHSFPAFRLGRHKSNKELVAFSGQEDEEQGEGDCQEVRKAHGLPVGQWVEWEWYNPTSHFKPSRLVYILFFMEFHLLLKRLKSHNQNPRC